MCYKIFKSWLYDICRKMLVWCKFILDIYVIVKVSIGIISGVL